MNLARVYAVFLRQIYLMRGNPTRFSFLLWIVFDIIQWGFISKYLGQLGQETFSFITVILGAIILWEFLSRIQQGVMTSFLEDIWSQNFINFFASPLKITEYIGGLVLTSLITGALGFVSMLLLAGLFFGYNILVVGAYIIPFLLILLIFGIAMGIFTSAMIFWLGPSAEWFGWPIPFILASFTGVFYPISTLPQVLQYIGKFFPSTYVFESMRAIVTGTALTKAIIFNLAIGTALALIFLFASYFLFVRVYHRNLKSGSLSRFESENYWS